MRELSLFGGAIQRRADGSWWWRDGNPEPRARDARPWAFHRMSQGGATYVEVLQKMANTYSALDWVRDGARDGRYAIAESSNHTSPILPFDRGWYRAFAHIHEDPLHNPEPAAEELGLIPNVIRIPLGIWESWAASTILGVEWDLEHHEEILTRARNLGWQG